MTAEQKKYLQQCSDTYRRDLIENIMPFWMENGLDRVKGGIFTCLDRDGKLMDTTKSVWFQGRFGFICAYAYNHIEKKQEWLSASVSCIKFLEDHCVDSDGHKFFTVTAEGEGIQKRRYVFSECFCAMAMAEYAKATGSKEYAEKALKEFQNLQQMMATPGFLPAKTSVPSRSLSITMMLINVAIIVKQVIGHPDMDAQIDSSLYDIEHYFMHPEFEALLESVTVDGKLIDTITGRVINPGHCIETAWFIMECAKTRADRDHLNEVALRILDWSWKWGWDEQYGGIINFKDCKNFPSQEYAQDMKFWWPQCETIIAMLYAYQISGDEKYLQMHRLANEWAYVHLKDNEYPEWYGYLHRDGSVAQPAKGNIYKGPFHIPRMLIKSQILCKEILDKQSSC